MRGMVMLGAGVALLTAGAADAQRVVQRGPGAGYPMPGHQAHPRPNMPMPPAPRASSRWGSKVGGHWWGGVNAPGGRAAYRRPFRGYRLPTYWVAPRFYVTDWSYYGLAAPTGGYRWARYYDDAVLIDQHGAVYDHREGIDWDGEHREHDRRSGAGGAIAGAVVGGIVGNVVAGRGDRLAGTLLGAGVGAAGGYALDRATDRRRGEHGDMRHHDEHDGYDEPPVAPDRAPPPPGMGDRRKVIILRRDSGGAMHRSGGWSSHDGRTDVVTTMHGGGRNYHVAPGAPVIVHAPYGVTTVTVHTQPSVTTTTTTEIIEEDSVTWTRPVAKRKVYASKRVWRAKAKPRCVCR